MPLSLAQSRALGWLAIALVAWLVLHGLGPVLLPFVAAAVLAYALQPLVAGMARRGVHRALAAVLAIVITLGLVLLCVMLVVPIVTRQLPLIREQLPALLEQLNLRLMPWLQRLGLDASIDVEWVRATLRGWVSGREGELLAQLLSGLRIGGSALAAWLGNLVLLPIVAFYLLVDWDRLADGLRQMVPPRWRDATLSFLDETDAVLGQYLRGQLLVMALLAVFYSAGLALVGLDLALPIGVFTGLAVFVPYLGFGLGLVLGLLAALLEFQALAPVALVALVFGAGQLIEGFYLTPRLLGQRIGLHPIAVIFALLAFGHLLGFVGVLIALPASAVLLVALRRLRQAYLSSALYRDHQDPPH